MIELPLACPGQTRISSLNVVHRWPRLRRLIHDHFDNHPPTKKHVMLRNCLAALMVLHSSVTLAGSTHAKIDDDFVEARDSSSSPYFTDVKKIRSFGAPVSTLKKPPSTQDVTSAVLSSIGLTEHDIQTMVEHSFSTHFAKMPRTDVSQTTGSREDIGTFGCTVMTVAGSRQSAFQVTCKMGSHGWKTNRKMIGDVRLGFSDTPALKQSIADAIDRSTKSLSDFFYAERD